MSVVKELAASVKAGNLITVCSIGIDEYENVTNEIANTLLKDEMGGAYITASRPSSILSKGIDVGHSEFYFIDMISQNIGGSTSGSTDNLNSNS